MDHDGTVMTCRKRCPRFHWGTLYPFPFETSRDSGLFGTKKISSKRNVWMSFYEDQRIMIIDSVVWIGNFHGTFGRLHSATRGTQYASILRSNRFFPNGSFEKRFALIGQILEMGESFGLPYILSTFPSTLSPLSIAFWLWRSHTPWFCWNCILAAPIRFASCPKAQGARSGKGWTGHMPLWCLWRLKKKWCHCCDSSSVPTYIVSMSRWCHLRPWHQGLGGLDVLSKAFCAVSCTFCPHGLLKS